MKKKQVRIVSDVLMFAVMCFLAGTGLLLHYRLVPGYRGGQGLTLLGLTRHEWGAYHFWAACILVFLVLVHLILGFTFIRSVIAAGRSWRWIALGLIGLLITLFFLLMPIERRGADAKGQGGRLRGTHAGRAIDSGRK